VKAVEGALAPDSDPLVNHNPVWALSESPCFFNSLLNPHGG
jgi:hypothetical protein